MFLIPAIVPLLPSTASFSVIILLFLIVNPLFALGFGIAAGFDLRRLWYVPLLTAFVYWLGTAVFVTESLDILFYVIVYMLLGAGAMLITHFIRYLLKK